MAERLNLAVVTETFPPEVNGVARTIGMMVTELCNRGHGLSIFRPRQLGEPGGSYEGRVKTKLLPGLAVPFYPEVRMGWPLFRFFQNAWSQTRPDLVHIVTEGPLGWSALKAAKKLKIPVVSDFHTNFHTYSSYYKMGLGRSLVKTYLRRFHNQTQATLVPTATLKESMELEGYQRLLVVGRGVDTELFHPSRRSTALRRTWKCSDSDPVFLYVGRIAPEKNLELLVEAFERISLQKPNAKLVLVGDGPLRNKLKSRLPAAVFPGVRRGESLARYYASADLFLFPSLSETFGNVVLEAMASGLAVISFDDAAASSVIESGKNGLLVPTQDQSLFSKSIQDLIATSDIWRQWGERARLAALGYSWERVVDDLESIFFQMAHHEGRISCKAIS